MSTNTAPNKNAVPKVDETDEWIKVQSSRAIYQAELCEKMPVRGIILGTSEFNPSATNAKDGNGKPWTGLVLKLTKACKGVRNRTVVDCHVGEEIIVGGYDMADLYRAANHPTKAFEVKLTPKEILALGGGRKMWLYEKLVNPKGHDRAEEKLFFFARTIKAPEQLPTRSESDTAGVDEIPF